LQESSFTEFSALSSAQAYLKNAAEDGGYRKIKNRLMQDV
jgi:hypothetical protein